MKTTLTDRATKKAPARRSPRLADQGFRWKI